jgi:hypothetical protein
LGFQEQELKNSEHALTHHTLASKEHLARPANWDSMTRTARKHYLTARAHGASAETLEAHGAMERNTKKPRLQNAGTAPIRHELPENWHLRSKRSKKK